MSKSAIYIVNPSTQVVQVDGVITPGTIIRRFGPNLALSGNGIQISGAGYYDIDATFNVAPTEVGEVTITAYLDGVQIPGAVATETAAAAGDFVNLSISALVRENCPCCAGLRTLTFVLSGISSNVTNTAIVVEKI